MIETLKVTSSLSTWRRKGWSTPVGWRASFLRCSTLWTRAGPQANGAPQGAALPGTPEAPGMADHYIKGKRSQQCLFLNLELGCYQTHQPHPLYTNIASTSCLQSSQVTIKKNIQAHAERHTLSTDTHVYLSNLVFSLGNPGKSRAFGVPSNFMIVMICSASSLPYKKWVDRVQLLSSLGAHSWESLT